MPAVAKEPSQFSDSSIWLLLEPPLLAGAETVRATWLVTTQFGHWSWSPTVVDTNNGFVLRGDYQLGTGVSFLIANSFSKSMSLYGERCGALSVVCPDADQAARVLGQMKFMIRRNYSNPPMHGGQIVARVLSTPELRSLRQNELGTSSEPNQS